MAKRGAVEARLPPGKRGVRVARFSARLGPGGKARALVSGALLSSAAVTLDGCQSCGEAAGEAALEADAGPGGLSARQADQVLARVGDRTIRLGDYAAALERMDELERLRYQTKDRRKALLEEMIDVELLAREAERRGLGERPETQELIRQLQRDAVLERLRRSLPGVESFSASEVAEYYRSHPDEFRQPEMRRVAHVELADEATARRVLARARAGDATTWKELVREHAPGPTGAEPDAPRAGTEAGSPEGLAVTAQPAETVPGDLGTIAREPTPGEDDPIDPALRRAAFAIAEEGGVHPEIVRANDRYHVVRLVTRVAPRRRTLAEVDSLIRVRLLEALQKKAEGELVDSLRKSLPVVVDEEALARVPDPEAAPGKGTQK